MNIEIFNPYLYTFIADTDYMTNLKIALQKTGSLSRATKNLIFPLYTTPTNARTAPTTITAISLLGKTWHSTAPRACVIVGLQLPTDVGIGTGFVVPTFIRSTLTSMHMRRFIVYNYMAK